MMYRLWNDKTKKYEDLNGNITQLKWIDGRLTPIYDWLKLESFSYKHDDNGKRMFENDIIEFRYEGLTDSTYHKGCVIIHEGKFMLCVNSDVYIHIDDPSILTKKVVGATNDYEETKNEGV